MDSETPEHPSNQSRIYWIIGLAVVILLVITRCGPEKPVAGYGWNQKMTLVVETAEGTYTGSAVQEMAYLYWACKGLRRMAPDCGAGARYMRGEAPFVELPDGSVVVATLDRYSLIYDKAEKDGKAIRVWSENLRELSEEVGYFVTYTAPIAQYPPEQFSTIWVFPDPTDDTSRAVLLSETRGRKVEPIISATLKIETTLETRSPSKIGDLLTFLALQQPGDVPVRFDPDFPPLRKHHVIKEIDWPTGYEHPIES